MKSKRIGGMKREWKLIVVITGLSVWALSYGDNSQLAIQPVSMSVTPVSQSPSVLTAGDIAKLQAQLNQLQQQIEKLQAQMTAEVKALQQEIISPKPIQ